MLVVAVPWMLSAAGAAAAVLRVQRRRGSVRARRGVEVAASGRGLRVHVGRAGGRSPRCSSAGITPCPSSVDKIEFRLGGCPASVEPGLGPRQRSNVEYWLTNVSTAWAVLLARLGGRRRRAGRRVPALRPGPPYSVRHAGVPAGLPLLWYELVRNHSQIHPGKAHVSIPFAVGVVVAAAVLAASRTALVVPTAPDDARSESEHA